ncbi:MAG TPA: response regulator, partial [Longimicrobiales bacterium]|nr:response regulator [Longimicrobiales bacterium]
MSPDRLLRKKTLKVLLAADDRHEVSLIRRSLRRGRGRLVMKVMDVPTIEGVLTHLEREDVDLVMLDLGLGVSFGADIVRGVRRTAPTVPIIVIADEEDERLAILAMQRDAQDYVLRHQLNPATLTQAVRYALEPDRWQGQYRRLL